MNNEAIKIREATESDLPSIIELYHSLETEPHKEEDGFDPVIRFQSMQHYPYHKLFVVELDCSVIATFTLTILEYLCHQDKNAAIMEAVVVDEHYRHQGIGKMMISYCLDQCKRHNCYKLALSSNIVRKDAHAFYEKQGFYLHGYSFAVDCTPQPPAEDLHD